MKIYIGTSGWTYDWNPDGFRWYAENANLNAVELNASFYRFPFPNQIKSWIRRSKDIRWAIKVHRSITHYRKFSKKSLEIWQKFYKLFKPMDELIDFFLFQLPPSIVPTENFIDNLEYFIKEVNLGPRFALEFRNEAWFSTKWVQWLKRLEVTMVSVDAPQLPREIYCTTGIVYLRMHGRTAWYAHNYSFDELREVAIKIIRTSPQKAYIFFNNNHDMLHNAHELQSIFNELIKYNRFYA